MRLFTLGEDRVASSIRDWVSEAGVVGDFMVASAAATKSSEIAMVTEE